MKNLQRLSTRNVLSNAMKNFCKFVKKHTGICAVILLIFLLISVVLGVGLGPVTIPFADVWKIIFHNLLESAGAGDLISVDGIRESTSNIVWFLRLPRVILGGLVGAALTMSGVGMQAFTKNPLADPYVLGISSGASLGAVLIMVEGVQLPFVGAAIPFGAFFGALISMILVYVLASTGNTVTPVRLILVGVAVSAMFSAFTNYIVYTAPDDASVREATFWMLGGFGSAKWSDVPILAIFILPAFFILLYFSKSLNAMLMGEHSAITLGVDLNLVRRVLIVVTAILTASSVAVSGCIGFVGLVIPHLVRSVVGADHRKLLPIATLCGAVFMIWVDVGARMIHPPTEIPVGILTAFMGAPLFLWMVKVRRYEFK